MPTQSYAPRACLFQVPAGEREKHMTLKKLAEICNVSVSTVSKAFSDSGEISEKTRQQIFDAAKKNGCFYKYYSENYKKKVVAVIIPEIKSAYYTTLVDGLEREFSKHNAMVTVSSTNFNRTAEWDLVQYYEDYAHADGIIIIGSSVKFEEQPKIPILNMFAESDQTTADSMHIKSGEATDDALGYLKKAGHREIAFIGEPLTKVRLDHFISSARRIGLKLQNKYIITSDERFELAGYKGMNELFGIPGRPTAIIAAYSYIANGIIKCIYDHGKSVPEDYSIVSMDDIFDFPGVEHDLARISMQREDICSTAAEMLLKKIYNPRYSARQSVTLYNRFVPGNTVKKLCEDL